MTTLASWGTTDGHEGIASLYIASDSRACCVENGEPIPKVLCDNYTKTFVSSETPDIFGVYGIVTYAPQIIKHVISRLTTIRANSPLKDYVTAISNSITDVRLAINCTDKFEIIHGYRFGARTFGCSRISVGIQGGIITATSKVLEININKHFELEWGSGGPHIFVVQRDDEETDARGLSRWHWQTIYEAITHTKDPFSGGAPQLVGLYTKGNGKHVGVFFKGKRYLAGIQTNDPAIISTVEWRDHLFQRVNGITGALIDGAQRHARNGKKAIRAEEQ